MYMYANSTKNDANIWTCTLKEIPFTLQLVSKRQNFGQS